ncbi:MAG: hypothetical protein AAGJ08_15760 [Cyanobacteria bacterium P01_H01_bin.35]
MNQKKGSAVPVVRLGEKVNEGIILLCLKAHNLGFFYSLFPPYLFPELIESEE